MKLSQEMFDTFVVGVRMIDASKNGHVPFGKLLRFHLGDEVQLAIHVVSMALAEDTPFF